MYVLKEGKKHANHIIIPLKLLLVTNVCKPSDNELVGPHRGQLPATRSAFCTERKAHKKQAEALFECNLNHRHFVI